MFSAKTDYIIHKVIAFALILSLLIVDKYELNVAQLIEAMNLSKSKLLLMASVLPVRSVQSGQFVALKLPSKLRQVSRTFIRKRRA